MSKNTACFINEEKLLTDDEIIKVIQLMARCGVKKLRLTGGEPLARENTSEIIKEINNIEGIEEIYMTTNGLLLEGREREFKEAGLKGVNISLDSLNEETYRKITRGGKLKTVLKVIDNLLVEDIKVKVNSVVIEGINEKEINDLVKLTLDKKIDVRFIELMPIGEGKDLIPVDNRKVKEVISERYSFIEENKNSMDGPAEYIRIKNAKGRIGFISAMSNNFCDSCNRIRITADGFLKQCLHWKYGVDLKELIRAGMKDNELIDEIRKNIYNKPSKHGFNEASIDRDNRYMNQIGG